MSAALLPATSQRSTLPTYKPNAADEKFIRDGIAYLSMTAPFFSHLLYSQMAIKYSLAIPYAATDGHDIFVNPTAMKDAGWGIEEVAFVLAHEVMHYVFGDLILMVIWKRTSEVVLADGTRLPWHGGKMNKAADYRINAALIEGKIGRFPKIGLYDTNLSAKGMESCIEIYAKLPDGADEDGFDEHLEPGDQEVSEDQSVGKIKRTQAIAAAVQAHQMAGMGELPGAIRELIGELLSPKVKWQDRLRSAMERAVGSPALDWRALNRRLISRPERIVFARESHYGCGTIVVGYDTSGSCINAETQRRFFSEMAGIVDELNPAELIVIWCDSEVQRVDNLEEPEDLETLRMEINNAGGAPGGGGTAFEPVFKWVEENDVQPDMLVYLTDIYGSFPEKAPDYEVIWATIGGTHVPFGEVIEVEL